MEMPKLRKIRYYQKKKTKRVHWQNNHHLIPRSRGGKSVRNNLLRMDALRHYCWHVLFQNLTIPEIIKILYKVKRMKER